jgi:hypothetical protein
MYISRLKNMTFITCHYSHPIKNIKWEGERRDKNKEKDSEDMLKLRLRHH